MPSNTFICCESCSTVFNYEDHKFNVSLVYEAGFGAVHGPVQGFATLDFDRRLFLDTSFFCKKCVQGEAEESHRRRKREKLQQIVEQLNVEDEERELERQRRRDDANDTSSPPQNGDDGDGGHPPGGHGRGRRRLWESDNPVPPMTPPPWERDSQQEPPQSPPCMKKMKKGCRMENNVNLLTLTQEQIMNWESVTLPEEDSSSDSDDSTDTDWEEGTPEPRNLGTRIAREEFANIRRRMEERRLRRNRDGDGVGLESFLMRQYSRSQRRNSLGEE